MKKLLLSLAMVLGFIAVNAATVTIDPENWAGKWTGDGEAWTATIGGYTFTMDKAGSNTALVAHDQYSIRVYQGATLTITAPSGAVMKNITFTVAQSSKGTENSHVTYSAGWTLTGEVTSTAGSTFGAASTGLSTFTMTAGKQIRIAKIEVSDEEGGETPVDPDPVTPDPDPVTPGTEGEVTVESPFSQFKDFAGGENNVGGFTFVFDKTTGTTPPQVYQDNLRLYAKNTLTISGPKVSKIVFTFTEDNNFRYTDFTPSTGLYTTTQAKGDTELTWTGDATSVTFTVGDKAVYGDDGEAKAGQIRLAKITVYGEAGETPVDPDPITPDPVDPADGVVLANPFANLTVPGESNVSGYTIAIEKLPSATTPPAVNSKGELRIYANNTFTVSGKKVTKVVFTFTSDNKYRYTTLTPSTGAYTAEQAVGDTELTWIGDAASVTFTVGEKATMGEDGADKAGQIRIEKITIYGEPGEGGTTPVDPVDPTEGVTVTKSNILVTGQVAFVFNEGYVSTFENSKTYGYWMATSTTIDDEMTVAKDAIFTIASTDKGYTIMDSYNRYMGWDGSHWSFNAYTTPEDGNSYWDITMVGDKVKIVNKAKSTEGNEVYLAGKTYNSDYEMCPTDRADQTLPSLYVVKTSSIFEVVENEDAPVVYYNLQGVQVENPSNGIFIRRQGNKTTKVLVK